MPEQVTVHQSEFSPLLVSQTSNVASKSNEQLGKASVFETILNLMKTCMGNGVLALAFACSQGGIVVFTFGLLAIAAWNIYSVQRLCSCLDYIPQKKTKPWLEMEEVETVLSFSSEDSEIHPTQDTAPPPGTATLGVVAWYAYGPVGLQVLDVMMLLLLMGIITAYVAAVVSFIGDTPLSLGPLWDAALGGLAMAFLALVPDLGYLSRVSATGLVVLILTFVVIAVFGIAHESNHNGAPLRIWPESLSGLSHWFGIVVYGFGVVPLTYNFRESMSEPNKMVGATSIALTGVALLNIAMGAGLYILYPNVTGEVMHELGGGFVPLLTRLAMVWVVIMTAPLLIVPCSELVEGKFQIASRSIFSPRRVLTRFGVVTCAVFMAVLLPGFVQVLSFVGCACVGFVGFCLPPILHMRLVHLSSSKERVPDKKGYILDVLLLGWGVFATIFSTVYTIRKS